MRHPIAIRSGLGVSLALATLALGSCVDAPSAPDEENPTGAPFVLAPVFSLLGPNGSVPTGPQRSALSDAFDQVNRFRMVVTRVPSGEVALDVIIDVTPGQDQYDLSVNVEVRGATEQFSVMLTALNGTVELFTSPPIPVTVTAGAGSAGAPTPTAIDVPLSYSGPGATATSVVIQPAQVVLAPGGTAQFSAQVLDQSNQLIQGALIAWVTDGPAVATVNATGLATAAGDGKTRIIVGTPAGLQDTAWVYVLGGELAYVEGGDLKVRAPAGGTAVVRASGGASTPAWSADGKKLYYSAGGQVRVAGGGPLAAGTWPAPSPDGTKLVVDGVGFINDDGSNPTPGPSGSTPLWLDDETLLLVAGGSLQRVRADGTDRATVVAGDASLPALSGGTIAYLSGGTLRVQGRAEPLLTGAGGRPSWSADGAWLVVSAGSELTLVPSDGGAPPVALPGLSAASQPAFRPNGGFTVPPTPVVTGFGPTVPRPGEVVTLVGSGFDWIIPANTRVFWPVPGIPGSVEGKVRKVTATQVEVLMPANVVAGQVRVTTRAGFALLTYTPSTSTLEVSARTPWGAPVAGTVVVIKSSTGTVLGQGTTDKEGVAVIAGIVPGEVKVEISAPAGYKLDGEAVRALTLQTGPTSLDLVATPQVKSVKLSPEKPTLGVLDELGVTVEPLDANGEPIPEIQSIEWASASSKLDVWKGDELNTTIVGRQPSVTAGDAGFTVTLDGQVFNFTATVTSSIAGTVTQDPTPVGAPSGAPSATAGLANGPAPVAAATEPAFDITVKVLLGEKQVGTATTSKAGVYSVGGLLAGTYEVSAVAKGDYSSVPLSQSVTLDAAHPTGEADFHMSLGVADSVVAAVTAAVLESLGAMTTVKFEAYDSLGVLLGGRTATYATTDIDILTVDGTGKVTAVDNGSAWVRVTVDGVKDSVLVTVDQEAVSLQLFKDPGEPAPDSARFLVQETFTILHEAKDANGNLIPASHRKPTYTPNTGKLNIDVDGFAAASAWNVGREVVIAAMDAASDTLIVWVLGVRAGDLTLPGDLATLVDSLYGQIQGTLRIVGTGLTDLDGLATLFDVWGDVNIGDNPFLSDLDGLAGLESVGGSLVLEGLPAFAGPTVLPSLREVWDDVYLRQGGVALRFPMLETVGEGVVIGEWAGEGSDDITVSVDFPALTCTGGWFEVAGNLSLESLTLPILPEIGASCSSAPPVTPAPDRGAYLAPFPGRGGFPPREGVTAPARAAQERIEDARRAVERRADARLRVKEGRERAEREQESQRDAERAQLRARRIADEDPPTESVERSLAAGAGGAAAARWAERAADRAAARAPSDETRGAVTDRPKAVPERVSRLKLSAVAITSAGNLDLIDNPALTTLDVSSLRVVNGSITVTGGSIPSLVFPALELALEFNVWDTPITSLSAPLLRELAWWDLDVWGNAQLVSLDLPMLRYVGDDIDIDSNASLLELHLPALEWVEEEVDIDYNDALTSIRLPLLAGQEEDDEDFSIHTNASLQTVSVSETVTFTSGNDVEIYANPALLSISWPGLASVYDDLEIYDNASLRTVTLGTLAPFYAGDGVYISNNPQLRTVEMPKLQETSDDLEFWNNPALELVSAPEVSRVRRDFSFYANGSATTPLVLDFPLLASVGSFWGDVDMDSNPGLVTLSLPALTSSGQDVWILNNPNLATIDLPLLASTGGWFEVDGNAVLTSFSVPSLTTVNHFFQVDDHPALTTFSAPVLSTVKFGVFIGTNVALTSFDLGALTSVGPFVGPDYVLEISNNPALTDFDLGSLTAVGVFSLISNATLTTLPPLGGLGVGAGVQILGNPLLADLDGLSGTTGLGRLWVEQNPALTDATSLSGVQKAKSVWIFDNDALAGLSMNALTGVSSDLQIRYNDALTSLSFAALTLIGEGLGPTSLLGDLYLGSNAVLSSVSFPVLADIDSDVSIVDNLALSDLDGFSALTSSVWSLQITANPALVDVTGLNSLGDTGTPPAAQNFIIQNNPTLTDAAAAALAATIETNNAGPNDDLPTVSISGNN